MRVALPSAIFIRLYRADLLPLICSMLLLFAFARENGFAADIASPGSNEPQYSSRLWQKADGLPHDCVFAVVQGKDGYIWAATAMGLVRFDGVRFAIFDRQNTPAMKDPKIRNMFQSSDGTLWLFPESGGLLTLKDGVFNENSLVASRTVNTMLESSDGSLWVGTVNGLLRWHSGESQWFVKTNGLIDDSVLALAEQKDGSIWIGTGNGLNHYKEKFLESYTETNGLPAKSVRALLFDAEGTLWLGSGGGGLQSFRNGVFTGYPKGNGLPDGFVRSIFEDSRKNLWIGTMAGICRRTGDRFVPQMNSEGMPFETVYGLVEDHEEGIWLATKEGLVQLRRKPFQCISSLQGLAHNNVMSVFEDSHGALWMATWGGGLSKLQNNEIISYNRSNSSLFDVLLGIWQTTDGSLWIGTDFDEGLYQFKDNYFIRYGAPDGLHDSAIRVIYEDREKHLWVGATGGLYLRENDKFVRFNTKDGLANEVIRVLYEDRAGNLWIGTNRGLSRRKDGEFEIIQVPGLSPADAVLAIYEDKEGTLWLGSGEHGLIRYEQGHSTGYTQKQGLFSDSISEILEDDRGNLWMSCFSGVFRVKKKELDLIGKGLAETVNCVVYGKADGMTSVQCNGVAKPAAWKGRDGRFWFATTRGVMVVDPNSIRDNETQPKVLVEEIVADKKLLTSKPETDSSLQISPGRGEIELHYTALSFSAPDKIRFKYKLEGLNNDWVDAGNRRTAFYNNLPPGNYKFLVKACSGEGIWNETGATAALVLLPHYWQTAWFKVLTVLSAILAVSAVARYVTWKRVQGRLLRLEQQHALEKERARISRDMHDDLGASLTQIVMLSDIARSTQNTQTHLTKISTVARDLVRGFDAIVWSVNPRNDSLEKFVFYICEYLRMFLGDGPIASRVDLPDELPAVPLASEVRHNLFLIIKEAVNNVVKHSQASELWFRVRIEQQILKVIIEDNGKGFSSDPGSAFSNGLENMRKRSENIGGRFCVDSLRGRGTQIAIHIPLRQVDRKQ